MILATPISRDTRKRAYTRRGEKAWHMQYRSVHLRRLENVCRVQNSAATLSWKWPNDRAIWRFDYYAEAGSHEPYRQLLQTRYRFTPVQSRCSGFHFKGVSSLPGDVIILQTIGVV
jgi:hypothetical protein